jgi:predicted short-subunit dehydrogenase-like oxidoreductase (DUF2520 family)
VSALEHVLIVGPGRAGMALGYALLQAEAIDALTVCGRRPEPPSHPLFTQALAEYVFGLRRPRPHTGAVFLAVPDSAVPEMAHVLAVQGPAPEGCAAFHLSGALSTEVLAPLHARGYAVGSFHPLQAIAHAVTGAERLPGSWIAVTGVPAAVSVARRLAAYLASPVLSVPEARRPLYHSAAVMASNFIPPLVGAASRLLQRAGVAPDEALAALLPLVRGTVENIAELGVEGAVTGPIPRGDVDTVDLHLRALEPGDRRLYAVLGLELLRLSADGLPEEARRELMERLNSEIVG